MDKWLKARRNEIIEDGLFLWMFNAVLFVSFLVCFSPFWLIWFLFQSINDCTKKWFMKGDVTNG